MISPLTKTHPCLFLNSFWIIPTFLIVFFFYQPVLAQVVYDGNGSLIGTMTDISSDILVQGSFTVPSGSDRVLIVFITEDGSSNTFTDSVTFNGLHLTKQIENSGGPVGLESEIWHLPLGCGNIETSMITTYFSNIGGGSMDVIVGASSFQNVDQFDVFGASTLVNGQGSSAGPIGITTNDSDGMVISIMSTEVSSGNPVPITPTGTGQMEFYEGNIGNNSGEGSFLSASGGTDELSWSFNSFCEWQGVALELLVSDSDGDGVADCSDLCPMDPLKSDPGDCGCGEPETDSDLDGTPDCIDLCPDDILKTEPGICGCGVSDIDSDSDGVADCIDFDVIRVRDDDSNILFEVNDEGLVGSITLKDTSIAPEITTNKIYGINGALHYNGISLASQDSSAGWTHISPILRLSTISDKVGVGTTNPMSKLSINGNGFSNTSLYSENVNQNSTAVYGISTNSSGNGKGGHFESNSTVGTGVEGIATSSTGNNQGGHFESGSVVGRGVEGIASNVSGTTNTGGYFSSAGNEGFGVFGIATSLQSGVKYGGYFQAQNSGGRAVYGLGGDFGGYFEGDTAVFGRSAFMGGNFEALNSGSTGVRASGKQFDFFADGIGTDYGSSSSRRWKTDISEISNPLNKLNALRGVYYTWDENHGGHRDIGMIAEEVGEILPEIVDYEENGIDAIGLDYSKLTPLLIEAVKELSKQVEKLSERNDLMEQINSQLRSDVIKLQSELKQLKPENIRLDTNGN